MSYHYDDGTYLLGITKMQPAHFDFNLHDFRWGTVQFYFVWIAIKIAQLFGYVDATWTKLFSQFDMPVGFLIDEPYALLSFEEFYTQEKPRRMDK